MKYLFVLESLLLHQVLFSYQHNLPLSSFRNNTLENDETLRRNRELQIKNAANGIRHRTHKRNDDEPLSFIINKVKENLKKGGYPFLSKQVYSYPLTTEGITCDSKKEIPLIGYEKASCTHVPGKIICKLGKYNYIINNGKHKMDKDIVERFISMVYQRSEEGDKCFDVAVDEKMTTVCTCAPTALDTTEAKMDWDEPITVIECNLLSFDKLKMCNPTFVPTEKIYECKTKKMAIKSGRVTRIAVNDDGSVSYFDRPATSLVKVRRKRRAEWEPNWESEDSKDERYRSNLIYHTKVPSVRNYSDSCPYHYYWQKWCPQMELKTLCANSETETEPYTNRSSTDNRVESFNNTTYATSAYTRESSVSTSVYSNTTKEASTKCTVEKPDDEALKERFASKLRKLNFLPYRRKKRKFPRPVTLIRNTSDLNENDLPYDFFQSANQYLRRWFQQDMSTSNNLNNHQNMSNKIIDDASHVISVTQPLNSNILLVTPAAPLQRYRVASTESRTQPASTQINELPPYIKQLKGLESTTNTHLDQQRQPLESISNNPPEQLQPNELPYNDKINQFQKLSDSVPQTSKMVQQFFDVNNKMKQYNPFLSTKGPTPNPLVTQNTYFVRNQRRSKRKLHFRGHPGVRKRHHVKTKRDVRRGLFSNK